MALYYNILSFLIVSISLVSSSSANNGGSLTFDLIHSDSRLSPLFNPTETRFDRAKKSVSNSFHRYNYFKSLLTHSTDAVDAPVRSAGGGFVMRIGIGTPPTEVWAIADTGSDLSWTQCTPCTDCFKQDDPLFDPTKSSSYKKISCESDQCNLASGKSSCRGDVCTYTVGYGDQSHSRGDLATEAFTFGSGKNASFNNVVFGCGHDNAGTFNRKTSGIIGLGGGDVSIVQQLDKSFAGKFAYCLTTPASNATSKISFGEDAIAGGGGGGGNVVSTPILSSGTTKTFYFLSLEGISVGNTKFDLKNSDGPRQITVGGEGNIIIDSGTTLTFLPSELYDKFESELKKSIDADPVSSPEPGLSLCYKLPSDGVLKTPTVTAHFKGADVAIPKEGIFLEVEEGVVCVTFSSADQIAIFGNLHQLNYLVGYYLKGKKVSFQKTDCSKSGRKTVGEN